MDVELHLQYRAGPADVAALLADPRFVEDLCAASAATSWHVEVSGTSAGPFTVTSERVLPTDELPDAIRRFLGASLTVHQVDEWAAPAADGSRTGTTRLEVAGAPVRASATHVLRASAAGCDQDVHGQLKASVPLLGARVEKAAEPVLVKALREQEELARTRLPQ